jgi:hypothetical protein
LQEARHPLGVLINAAARFASLRARHRDRRTPPTFPVLMTQTAGAVLGGLVVLLH